MNDQSQMMNQPPPVQMMNPAVLNQLNPAVAVQSQIMNPNQQMMMMSHQQQQQRSYKPWQQQQQQSHGFIPSKPRTAGNNNWKGKNVKQTNMTVGTNNTTAASGGGGAVGYKPPSLNELQSQNRMKAKKYYHPRKKFNNRFAPYAPRNTTSFIIRAKKSGGIASLVSPCPVTPAVLPTPIFSPSREVLGDMAKEEWGVDGYGSMKGLIRLRSPPGADDEEEDEGGNGSSESDVEEHVEVERRLDHDLSRFEMIYPSYSECGGGYNNVLENRVDDQDMHIAQLEEENLTLKERLFLMEREVGEMRRRLQILEKRSGVVGRGGGGAEDVNEEVVENAYANEENESDGGSDVGGGSANNEVTKEESRDVCMEEMMPTDEGILNGGEAKVGEERRLRESDELKSEDMEKMGEEGDHAVVAKSGDDTNTMPTDERIVNAVEANDEEDGSMLGETNELKSGDDTKTMPIDERIVNGVEANDEKDAEIMVAESDNAVVAARGGDDTLDEVVQENAAANEQG